MKNVLIKITLTAAIYCLISIAASEIKAQNGQCIEGDCSNGTGTYMWPSGDQYIGEFSNGKINGTGTYLWKNGTKYVGEWVNNRQEGKGTLTLYTGKERAGMWKAGQFVEAVSKPTPKEEPVVKNETKEGCLSGNCINGKGHYMWGDGSQYKGEYVDGEIHGKGKYSWPDGSYYEGGWKKGVRSGYGVYMSEKGARKAGSWENDKLVKLESKKTPVATTTPVKPQRNNNKKEGCISGDCENGNGKYYLGPKEYYEGAFADGSFNGHGSYFWADGSKYTGEWKNNKRHGKGTYYFPNLKRKAGIWDAGRFVREVKDMQTTVSETTIRPDIKAPEVTIEEPALARGITVTVKDENVTVKGYVTDETGVKSIRIAGVTAELGSPGAKKTSFKVEIPLQVGQNQIWAKAEDVQGNSDRKQFEIIREERFADIKYEKADNSNKKTALVIGNSDYEIAPLKNAVNDADSIATELTNLGFEVIHHTNMDFQQMEQAIENFGRILKTDGGVGMVFYAGHGIQVQGENYLVPVSANIKKENDIKYKSVHMGYLLDELEKAGNDLNIVVLDACRDNPYASKYRSSLKNGLAGVAVAPVGTFIAYATAPGTTASDGTGNNGLYTQELLKAMRVKGYKLEDIFKVVRSNVRKLSRGNQIPWENSSLEGDFYFRR